MFRDDSTKVTFALSYLRDVAQEWFEPGLSGLTPDIPTWLEDWDAFVNELQDNFGPFDESADVEHDLMTLRMKDNQRISDYLVRFNTLAVRCPWGESALRFRFYEGLPSRLKDELSKGEGKPRTLAGMRQKAQNADARYWERVQERSRENSGQASHKSASASTSTNTDRSNQSSNQSGKSKDKKKDKSSDSQKSDSGKSKPASSSTSSTSKPDLTGKLDSKGKLTAEERQSRIDKNLCLFCGKGGHRVSECNKAKASSSSAKGKAAAAEPSGSEKKKD
jgi:Retrotransposon gag protein